MKRVVDHSSVIQATVIQIVLISSVSCMGYLRQNQLPLINPNSFLPCGNRKVLEIVCHLCWGNIRGWIVVQSAYTYMNSRIRCCAQNLAIFLEIMMN